MITERYRQSMQITANDIFMDFNDPRKQTLAKRVVIALQDQQKRLKAELDNNNLSNLQILLKKQQTLKNLEDKLRNKDEQISELKIRLNASANKLEQLQKQLSKRAEITNGAQQKVKSLTSSLKNLEYMMKSRDSLQLTLQKQKQSLLSRAEQLQIEKQKQEKLIANLRNSYQQKVEQTEYVLKIKQKQMAEEFNQNLNQFVVKKQKEKQRQQIKNRLDNSQYKVPTKTQKIQCDLLALTGRQSPSPRKKHHTKGYQISTQTDKFEEKILEQIIVHNQKIKQPEKQLEEVRLMYSKTPPMATPKAITPKPQIQQATQHTPKVTSYVSIFTQQKELQTQKITILDRHIAYASQSVQTNTKTENPVPSQIQKYKQKFVSMRQFYQNRYQQLKLILKQKQEQLEKTEHYKLQILQLNLQIRNKQQQFANQREILTRMNQQLQVTQSQFMRRNFSSKLCQQNTEKIKNYKTCSFFNKKQKGDLKQDKQHKELWRSGILNRFSEQKGRNLQESPMLSPKKWEQQSADIITVVKKANNLKFFNNRRRSTTESASPGSTIVSNLSIARRAYRKYSTSKKP